jgi:hypothetical protein
VVNMGGDNQSTGTIVDALLRFITLDKLGVSLSIPDKVLEQITEPKEPKDETEKETSKPE